MKKLQILKKEYRIRIKRYLLVIIQLPDRNNILLNEYKFELIYFGKEETF